VLAVAGVTAASARRGSPPERRPAPRAAALPEPPHAAFTIGAPVPLADDRYASRWAPVRHAVPARAGPAADAPVIATLDRHTPEGTTNLATTLARTTGADGRIWVKVRLAVLPNGTTGWVPRSALGGYATVTTRLVVDRERLTATLLRAGRRIFHVPIGVGSPASPTPAGEFYVRNRLTKFSSPFYGPVALGTSARSDQLTDWPGGGFIGIHGTDRPDLIPGRVSHGCIRMRNADIVRLAKLLPIGTPVTIH
jgi:lipoprotein-anchoring transpeptidase ErfK/SrfK